MAKDSAIEFTEERYATRAEMGYLMGGLRVSDESWNRVMNYRKGFMIELPLCDVEYKDIYLCTYPMLSSKIHQLENKLLIIGKEYEKLSDLSGNKQHLELVLTASCLKTLANFLGYNLDENRIRKLITSENPFDEQEEKLLNYVDALNFIKERHANKIDKSFISVLYQKILGPSVLTYDYREEDIVDNDYKSLVGRVYNSAPANRIEQMMDTLFEYLSSSGSSPLTKALVAYYFVNYVKPFNNNHSLVALLTAKAVLAHESVGDVASFIPLEDLLLERNFKRMMQDAIAYTDATYVVSPSTFRISDEIEEVISLIRDYSIKDLRDDFYQADEPVVEKNEEVQAEEEPAKVEETPMVEEVKEEPVEKEEKKVSVPVVNEAPGELAIDYIPQKIDEKVASRLEEHLLELDPRLKKGQAKFYARHCTKGMYYTIEQYKKCVKCVYETARTSMDGLVELGYYEKAQAGKKFVYTPVKRK